MTPAQPAAQGGEPDRPTGFASVRRDAVAGLTAAINNVTDGMANAIIVGVNPLFGLYANIVGPIVGGAVSSTQLMLVTTTAAASLTVARALPEGGTEEQLATLAAIVVLSGLFQILFSVLRLAVLIRFVSFSVMNGLLLGIAALLVLSQLPNATGVEVASGNRVRQTIELLQSLDQVSVASVLTALSTFVLAALLPRTRLGNFGILLSIAIPSGVLYLLGVDGVRLVRDVGAVSGALPGIRVPSLGIISIEVLTSAFALAVIVLIQGAGVSQTVPNPDGSRRKLSRDFIASGAANVASGLIGALPVGGSVNATALNRVAGAGSRNAALLAGGWMALLVLGVPGLVGMVAIPSLAATLIRAGVRSVRVSNLILIGSVGWRSEAAALATFLACLAFSLQAAVLIGLVLSVVLYIQETAGDVAVVEQVLQPDGSVEERPAPKRLRPRQVTILEIYGHLFFGTIRSIKELLPEAEGVERPVVVLRLRGQSHLSATVIDVLAEYGKAVNKAGGRLYLSGVDERISRELSRVRRFELIGPVQIHTATPRLRESTWDAVTDAEAWLMSQDDEESQKGREA